MIYDVVIIGAGPGGLSAAIYAARAGLKALVLESRMPGGLLNYTNEVRNYPGFKCITGPDLAMKIYEHFLEYKVDFKTEEVTDLIDGETKKVITQNGEYETKNVIIASGRSRRSLGLEHEDDLRGNGISYCAMCDGHFYKGKTVGVVGAGDSSLEESLYLAKLVEKLYIIVRGKVLSGNKELVERVNNCPNIEVLFEHRIKELSVDNGLLHGVVFEDENTLNLDGLFVYIGFDPVLPFKSDLDIKKENGYILVDENCMTNIEGVYAIGDIVKKKLYQIISAECEGAIAASSIARGNKKK